MSSYSQWRISKSEVVSDAGVVATMYPQASEAGAEILRLGGNAADAAVAAGFAVGVVEPFNSGLGGIAILVYYEAATRKCYVLDGTGTLPQAIRPDHFTVVAGSGRDDVYGWGTVEDDANNTGYQTPAVPGTPACLCETQRLFGRLTLADVMGPAIEYADKGFPLDWYVALGIAVNQHRLQRFPESRRTFFRPDGACYRAPMLGVGGDLLRQPDLASSLRLIAREGADVVYRGAIAERIADDMRANGGLLTGQDLADYRLRISEGGISGEYRGHQIIGGMENSGFPTVLETLNILEGFDLRKKGSGSVDEMHLLAEAQRLAFRDRFAYLADGQSAPVPLEGMLSKPYAAERRRQIDLTRALIDAAEGDPWAFQPGVRSAKLNPAGGGQTHTTHLTVVDRDHNMATLTSTLGLHFGSGVVAKGTGIVLNNGTMWFNPRPGSVNSIAPGRRLMTAAAPTVVLRDGHPLMALGSPGGRRVISSVIQTIVNVIDHGLGPQSAVTRPRVHSESAETVVDIRVGDERLRELSDRGHMLDVREETFSTTYFGRPNAVLIDENDGMIRGGVNQYKPALAIGL